MIRAVCTARATIGVKASTVNLSSSLNASTRLEVGPEEALEVVRRAWREATDQAAIPP